MQIQGPTSLDVLAAACSVPPDPFPYFAVAEVKMGGQDSSRLPNGLVAASSDSRSTRAPRPMPRPLGPVVETGAAHGLEVQSLESLGIRRIAAGILDNGTDIDPR